MAMTQNSKTADLAGQNSSNPGRRLTDRIQARLSQLGWFLGGLGFGFTALSLTLASVPRGGGAPKSAAETAGLQDSVSEIRVPRTSKIDFDSDIAGLASRERLYREDPRTAIAQSRRNSRVRVAELKRGSVRAPLKKKAIPVPSQGSQK